MYTKIIGEQQVQILSPNFSISPSNEDYVLNISANGRDFSPLFAVSAGVTRLVSNVAPGSYYKLVGNRSEVVINWQRMCATDGGSFDPTVLDPYWTSAQTVDYVDGVVASGINLDAYWTSAETQSAITVVEDHLFDVEEVTASALTELHEGLLELSARTGGNSNILAPITSQAEYAAISGSVKNGDLIQVQGVVLYGYDGPQYGLFEAAVEEEETDGVVNKIISWSRKDNSNSVFWSEDYPWMVENGITPVDFFGGSFLIAVDELAAERGEDEAYNGIGFDSDGKPVITHISPEYDEQTGEITGMTREDRDILGELDTLDEVVSVYYTSAQTEDAISAATSGKADAANITGRNTGYYFPYYNEQGVITGDTQAYKANLTIHLSDGSRASANLFKDNNYGIPEIYVASTPGTAGQIAKSNGYGFTWANDDKVSSTYVSTIWKGTQTEYDTITESGITADPTTLYIII